MFRGTRIGPLLIGAVLGVLAAATFPEPAAPADEDKAAVDCFGDPLPPGALARLGTMRMRQPEGVNGLAFSADGKTVIATGRSSTIHYWDPTTGREVRSVVEEHGQWNGLALSADGKLLALSVTNNSRLAKPSYWISLRDAATGKEVRQFANTRSSSYGFALSPNGKTLATTDSDSVVLWDTATGRRRDELLGLDRKVYHLEFSPDGGSLALGLADATVRFFDPAKGKEVGQRLDLEEGVGALAFSPDGQLIATGCYYKPNENNSTRRRIGIVTLWDVNSRKKVGQLEGQDDRVQAMAFTPDGKRLALAAGDTVRLWDLKTRKQLQEFEARSNLLVFSPDGKTLAAGTWNHVLLWDTVTGKEPAWQTGHETIVRYLVFSPDGRTIASLSRDDGIVRTWDAATGRQLCRFSGPSTATRQLSFIGNQTLLTVDNDNTVQLWDITSGHERHRFKGGKSHRDSDCCVAAAPAGNLLAVADEKTVRLYSPQTGKELRCLRDAVMVVKGMAFSPDGKRLAVVHAGKRIDLWDVEKGDLLHQLKGHGGLPHWLAYARDGETLISLTEKDGLTVHLWDAATRKECGQFKIPEPDATNLLAASPDGRFLAVADSLASRLDLWDLALSRKLATLRAPRDWATGGTGIHLWFCSSAFAPDGRTLITLNEEGVMQLWEVGTGEEIRRWGKPKSSGEAEKDAGGAPEEVRPTRLGSAGLAFSPDGRSVAVNEDDLILLWDVTGRASPGGLSRLDLEAVERDRLWEDLNQPQAAKAHRALWALVAAGDKVVPFVLDKLRPRDAAARRIEQLVAELDSVEYAVRQAATKELELIGLAAEPAMRAALDNRPGLEMRRRLEGLVEKLELTGRVRVPRAVGVLEQVGTPAARGALEELAKGAPESRLTQEARSSLGRLAKRP